MKSLDSTAHSAGSQRFPTRPYEPTGGVPTNGNATSDGTTLDRALAILDYLAVVRSANPSQIAAELGLSRSTAYRMLQRLRDKGYIDDTGTEGMWRLGPAVARMAISVIETSEIARVAPPYLGILVHQARESIGLGIPQSGHMVFIYRDPGPQSVNVNVEVGARRPMHCTAVGKAYLAALAPEDRTALISTMLLTPKTRRTIWRPDRLEEEIRATIERGWSQDLQEFDEASTCVGAPVLDRTGAPVAAISISGVSARVMPLLPKLGALVAATAEAISRSLGYSEFSSPSAVAGGGADRLRYGEQR
jgi:DNA-binding IclR family transcriptional regulator